MRWQRTIILGVALAAAVASPVLATHGGDATVPPVVRVGSPGLDSRIPAPNPPTPRSMVTTSAVNGTQVVRCTCLTHRLPTFDSPLEAGFRAG